MVAQVKNHMDSYREMTGKWPASTYRTRMARVWTTNPAMVSIRPVFAIPSRMLNRYRRYITVAIK